MPDLTPPTPGRVTADQPHFETRPMVPTARTLGLILPVAMAVACGIVMQIFYMNVPVPAGIQGTWLVAFAGIVLPILMGVLYTEMVPTRSWAFGLVAAPLCIVCVYAQIVDVRIPVEFGLHAFVVGELFIAEILLLIQSAYHVFHLDIARSREETEAWARRWMVLAGLLGGLTFYLMIPPLPGISLTQITPPSAYTRLWITLYFGLEGLTFSLYVGVWLQRHEIATPVRQQLLRLAFLFSAVWLGSAGVSIAVQLEGVINLWTISFGIALLVLSIGLLCIRATPPHLFIGATTDLRADAAEIERAHAAVSESEDHIFDAPDHSPTAVLNMLTQSIGQPRLSNLQDSASHKVRSDLSVQSEVVADYLTHTAGQLIDHADIVAEIAQIRDLPHVAGVWTAGTSLVVALHNLTMDSPVTGQVHAVGGVLVQISPTQPYVSLHSALSERHPYLLNKAADLSPIQATLAEQYAHHDLVGLVLTLCSYLQSPDPTFPGLGATLAQYPLQSATVPSAVGLSKP